MANPRNAVTTSRGRTYKWGSESFTSVTTILSRGIPKPALTNWAAKSVAEFVAENIDQVNTLCAKDKSAAIDLCKGSPWRTRDKAANLGTLIHDYAEAHVLGAARPDAPPEAEAKLAWFYAFLDDFAPEFVLSEATVFNRQWGWAGTLDAVCDIAGERWLIDYKTGKDVYPESALQLSAYERGEFVGMPDGTEAPMPPVDRCGVLHLSDTGYRLIPVETGDEVYRCFLYAQQIQRFVDEMSNDVLGAPWPSPKEGVPA